MKPIKTIDEITTLLKKYDGVSVLDTYQTSTRISISLTIESHKSHHCLQYCSEGANVRFDCYCRYNPGAAEIVNNPALGLIYRFEIEKHEDDEEEFEDIKYLGAYLVWTLHGMKEIETQEANRLLNLWNALNVKENGGFR